MVYPQLFCTSILITETLTWTEGSMETAPILIHEHYFTGEAEADIEAYLGTTKGDAMVLLRDESTWLSLGDDARDAVNRWDNAEILTKDKVVLLKLSLIHI